MKTISSTDFRKTLSETLDRVIDDCEPVLVTRAGGDNCVVMSERDWAGFEETLYLMRSPKNAQRLLDAISEAERGEAVERELIDPDIEEDNAA